MDQCQGIYIIYQKKKIQSLNIVCYDLDVRSLCSYKIVNKIILANFTLDFLIILLISKNDIALPPV